MILGILQARLTSTRLPGKVLKKVCGKTLLELQIERVRRSKLLKKLVVATSEDAGDGQIEELCKRLDVSCYRGSLDDVLDRYYRAAILFGGETIVRITGDCPLFDPELADRIIERHKEEGDDYTSNTIEPTYPDGLDVEVMKFESLSRAWNDARKLSEREHVTLYIYTHPELFKLGSYKGKIDYSRLRWTVDEPEDFCFIRDVYEMLYPQKREFTSDDVHALLRKCPELTALNSKYKRNEGLARSLQDDRNLSESSGS
jgi:spore coat polysaccharide biosynthesis protein SpsF (cytidylyltransferase family)